MTDKPNSVNCWRCGKPCRVTDRGTYLCDCTSTPFDPEPVAEPAEPSASPETWKQDVRFPDFSAQQPVAGEGPRFVPGPRFCAWCSAWQGDGENHSKFCDRPERGTPKLEEAIDAIMRLEYTQDRAWRRAHVGQALRPFITPACSPTAPDFHSWLTRVHGFKVGIHRNSYKESDLEAAWNAGMAHRYEVIGAKPLCLDCHGAGIGNCSHFDNCSGKWVYVATPASTGERDADESYAECSDEAVKLLAIIENAVDYEEGCEAVFELRKLLPNIDRYVKDEVADQIEKVSTGEANGFVQHPVEGNPSCHVCGHPMHVVRATHPNFYYGCNHCGTTTAPTSVPQAELDKCKHDKDFYNCDLCERAAQAEPKGETK